MSDFKREKATTFIGDIGRLVAGAGVSQIIGVLSTPIIARLYGPEAIGAAALFAALVAILGVVASLRYELAIVLPANEREAANLVAVSIGVTALISILLVPLLWTFGASILRLLNMQHLQTYIWLLPLTVGMQGVSATISYWSIRKKEFSWLSLAKVSGALLTALSSVGAGFAGYGSSGAKIASNFFGQAAMTAILLWRFWRDDRLYVRQNIAWKEALQAAEQHKNFPLIDSVSGLLNTTSAYLPAILLAAFFSPPVVGFYAVGYALLSLPSSLLSGAIAQVFFQRASLAKFDGSLVTITETTLKVLLTIAGMPFILLMIIGPSVFTVLLGSEWRAAGEYVQALAPWLLFVFVGAPLSSLVFVLNLQRANLVFNIVLTICRVLSLVVGGYASNVMLALALYSLSGTFLWLLFTCYLLSKAGISVRRAAYQIASRLFAAGIFISPVAMIAFFSNSTDLVVLVSGAFACLTYYIFSTFGDRHIRESVNLALRR